MEYTYVAVLTPSDNGKKVFASIPDFQSCITSGRNIDDAINMITDAASGWLVTAEDCGDPIPSPTPLNQVDVSGNSIKVMICINTTAYRKKANTYSPLK